MLREALTFNSEVLTRNVVARYLEKVGMEFPTEDARKQYLKEHPGADPKKHTVKKQEDKSRSKDEGDSKVDKAEVSKASKGLKGLKSKVKDAVFSSIEKVAAKAVDKIDDGIKAIGSLSTGRGARDEDKIKAGVKTLMIGGGIIGAAVGGALLGPHLNEIATYIHNALPSPAVGTRPWQMEQMWGPLKGWQLGVTAGGISGALSSGLGIFGSMSIANTISKWAGGKRSKEASWKLGAEKVPEDVKQAILDGMMDVTADDIEVIQYLLKVKGLFKGKKLDEDVMQDALVEYTMGKLQKQ